MRSGDGANDSTRGVDDVALSCRRFWLPRGTYPDLSDGGFLHDPELPYVRQGGPLAAPLESLTEVRVLGLLGEPGMAKPPHSMAKLNELGPAHRRAAAAFLQVDLAACGTDVLVCKRIFGSREFKSWKKSNAKLHLFLDGFDICLKYVQTLAGLRDKELREIRWEQIDLIHKKALTVGKSKTDAGTGRVIPLNETAIAALEAHAGWYTRRFGGCRPEWFVFAFGTPLPTDPTRPITSFKTAWTKVREKAGVKGRWHDNRPTLVTELAESGAGDEVIMTIAGHFSRAMLSRCSHVRMEAKRRALDEIATRQRTADEQRQQELERQAQAAMASPSLIQ
jgi:hypothetical protein